MVTFRDSPTDIPDPEVVPKAKRKFSAEYKLRMYLLNKQGQSQCNSPLNPKMLGESTAQTQDVAVGISSRPTAPRNIEKIPAYLGRVR
jgi:hypothetical protein